MIYENVFPEKEFLEKPWNREALPKCGLIKCFWNRKGLPGAREVQKNCFSKTFC
jgi:hypothetical protein